MIGFSVIKAIFLPAITYLLAHLAYHIILIPLIKSYTNTRKRLPSTEVKNVLHINTIDNRGGAQS
jgi:hypothetical protein